MFPSYGACSRWCTVPLNRLCSFRREGRLYVKSLRIPAPGGGGGLQRCPAKTGLKLYPQHPTASRAVQARFLSCVYSRSLWVEVLRSFLAGGLARVFSKTLQLCPCHERVPLVKAREDENDDLSSAAFPWLLLSHVANQLDVFDWVVASRMQLALPRPDWK